MQTNNLYDAPYLFWPYMSVYPGKTHDFALHPAFMATQLPAYPTYCRNSATTESTTTSAAFVNDVSESSEHSLHRRYHHQHPPGQAKPKRSSFTIDAILHGEAERKEEVKEQHSPSQLSTPSPIHHLQQTSPEAYLSARQHQRLLESAAHPYYDGGNPVTPIATASVKSVQKGEHLSLDQVVFLPSVFPLFQCFPPFSRFFVYLLIYSVISLLISLFIS